MTEFKLETGSMAGVIDIEIDSHDDAPRPKLAIVHRAEAGSVPDEWGAGAYVLVDILPSKGERRKVYVGEATKAGVSGRLQSHISKSSSLERWVFAVVIHGQDGGTQSKLTYEEAQALECELLKEFKRHSNIEVANKKDPSEPTLTGSGWDKIRSFVKPVIDLLKVYGCDVRKKPSTYWVAQAINATSHDSATALPPPSPTFPSPSAKKAKKPQKHFGVTLTDLVASGDLRVGDRLVPGGYAKKYSGEGFVVESNGKIYIMVNGAEYGSPSSAAKAISGNKAESGWHFWKRSSDGKSLDEVRKRLKRVQGIDDD